MQWILGTFPTTEYGCAPLGYGPVMGRQVAPSLPGGGNKRLQTRPQVRKIAMDPESDHEESQKNGKGYGLHDRSEPAGFRAEGVRCRAQVYAPVRPPATAEMGLY